MHWIVLWEILKYFEEILYNTHGYIFAIWGGGVVPDDFCMAVLF